MIQIKTLQDLEKAVKDKRAVYCPKSICKPWNVSMPAAFAINLTGAMLLSLFRQGLYIYESKRKRRK